jgi:hypothetical protein
MRKALPLITDDWPAGEPRPARMWPNCWGSIARPSALGSRSTKLAAWLSLYAPAGKPLELLVNMIAAAALRQWVQQTLYTIVQTRFRTKLKVLRPRHTRNP